MLMDEHPNNNQQFDSSSGGRRSCLSCGESHDLQLDCSPQDNRQFDSAQNLDTLIGKTIGGKYQIISLLGKGGMSRVYKAKQLPINKVVALKMLLGHLSHEQESVKRFLQEAKAAGQVSHANVVNVFDFGIAEDHQPYLVMDYLEGDTLSQLLKRQKRLSYQDAIPIFIEICDGLAAAHEHGVIHRDIKPSNIVLQNVPEGRRVRVVDFGIAKMIDADAQHLTKTGEVFGSPFYMSPEQCEGLTLDKRSDIYSLGVVFYETLSGNLPLAGKSAIETMSLHMQAIAPSLQKIAGVEIPLALENIVFKMMERNRDKRYADMMEVRQALKQAAAGESGELSGNISYVRREISRKSKLLATAMISVAVLGLVGVLAYPEACEMMAQQKYEEGRLEINGGHYEEAESPLVSAVDWSHKAGKTASESRSLALLALAYGHENKLDLAKEVRQRRRKLIRAALSSFDLSSQSIDDLVSQTGGTTGRLIAMQSGSAVQPEEADKLVEARSKDMEAGESDPKPKASPVPASQDKKSPVMDTRALARTDATGRPSSPPPPPGQPSPEPAPEPAGDVGANSVSRGNSPLNRRAASQPNTKKEKEEAAYGKDSSSSSRVDELVEEKKSQIKGTPLPINKQKAAYAPGVGGRASVTGGASGGAAAGMVAGGTAVSANQPQLQPGAAPNQNLMKNLHKAKASTTDRSAETDDMLDSLQVIIEACVDKQVFDKAKSCADRAIGLYNGRQPDGELAKLYSARAWSSLNLDQKERDSALADARRESALADVGTALETAQKSHAKSEEAEAEGIQALIYLESGKKAEAKECYGRVCHMLNTEKVPANPILTRAMTRYKQQASK